MTTPHPLDSFKLVALDELSPLSRRSLLNILGIRGAETLPENTLSDLCICEVADPDQLIPALKWAEERCGARIPLVFYPGPPVRILLTLRDLGPLAAWYFRAVAAVHG
ncbi:MAG: hypothetical protein H5T71_00500 [Chloroflexi bacterium]|uniref:hypothetical protein n=1 Tax=Thermogutta sp. TaxID=1962930 RepID=UPI0019C7FD80|nr:hypothetical protein [Thermogutta sp.]MBC7238569.1 hypothetical protein [Chloroflexota bacterium]MBC7351428.1 hypothetical protein [Thermogutta sp.]